MPKKPEALKSTARPNELSTALDVMIWQCVAAIPAGRVVTYGGLAAMAGYPSHARYVGRTLKQLPANTQLPWHRVVNAKGELSFPAGGDKYLQQKTLLQAEGVVFCGGKIRLNEYLWLG